MNQFPLNRQKRFALAASTLVFGMVMACSTDMSKPIVVPVSKSVEANNQKDGEVNPEQPPAASPTAAATATPSTLGVVELSAGGLQRKTGDQLRRSILQCILGPTAALDNTNHPLLQIKPEMFTDNITAVSDGRVKFLMPIRRPATISMGTQAVINSPGHRLKVNEPVEIVTDGTLPTGLSSTQTFTITLANPAVVTLAGHGLVANDIIEFRTSGALPTGQHTLSDGTVQTVNMVGRKYVREVLSDSTFTLSNDPGGPVIRTSGSQSGTHSLARGKVKVFVKEVQSDAAFTVSETAGGNALSASGSQTGSHSISFREGKSIIDIESPFIDVVGASTGVRADSVEDEMFLNSLFNIASVVAFNCDLSTAGCDCTTAAAASTMLQQCVPMFDPSSASYADAVSKLSDGNNCGASGSTAMLQRRRAITSLLSSYSFATYTIR